jgi:hypothetical protein
MQISLIKGDKVDSNVEYRDALPVNMYAVAREVLGAAGYMINWFGLSSFSDGQGIDRGSIWVSTQDLAGHYRVSGTSLISIDSTGEVTVLGEIPGDDNVSMDYSFNNLAIVANGNLYYYNPDDGLRQITDPDIGSPIDLVWVDGYFFMTDGKDIYHSDITDEESFLPLDFGNAQFAPDSSQGLGKNEDNEVMVFGDFSTEYFLNVGSENFAFSRLNQKAQKIGILGTHCKKELNGKWYTLSRRKETASSFHIVSLGSEQPISTRETDKVLAEYSPDDLSTTTIDTMMIDGTEFVIYHLPNHTLMFNGTIAATLGIDKAWTILKSDVQGESVYRGRNLTLDPRNGKWIIGDRLNSTIGYLDRSSCTHYGALAEWILYTPFVKMETLSINVLNMDTIPGIAPDGDATVSVSITQDGRTYSNEYWQLYGDNYDYGQRFYLRNVGYVREWIGFKFRGASRSRMAFSNLDVEAS